MFRPCLDINMTDLFADRSSAIAALSIDNILSNKTVTALVDSKIKVSFHCFLLYNRLILCL